MVRKAKSAAAESISIPPVSSPMPMPSIQLPELSRQYIAAHQMTKGYARQLRHAAEKLVERGIGDSTQLSSSSLNAFLDSRPSCESDHTRCNLRRQILTLWQWGFDERMIAEKPERIRKIKFLEESPVAWSFEQLCQLLSIAEKDEAVVSMKWCLRRCDVLPCWIRVGYESGLRFSDIHLLTRKHFRNGCLCRTASKTRKATIKRITADTQLSVDAMFARSPDGTLFRWALPRRLATVTWQAFLEDHAIEGSSKYLRRTGATLLESEHPGSATAFLGHSDPRLAAKHYIDPTLVAPPQGPPAIQRR